MTATPRRPWWVWVLVLTVAVAMMAAGLVVRTALDGDTWDTLMWFFPLYVIASAVCALMCWPARRDIFCILLVMMILSTVGLLLI